jgi:predicted permease
VGDGRLVDLLLRLYPAAFRERFGAEMRDAYRAQKGARRRRGRTALVALGLRTVVGMVRGAAAEWRSRAHTEGEGGSMGRREQDISIGGGSVGGKGGRMDNRKRHTGIGGWASAWQRELGYAARRLWRAPGFTILSVATLALGTGAFASVFTVVESVLLEPMPYERPEELAWVWRDYTWFDFPRGWLGSTEVQSMRDEAAVEALIVTRSARSTLGGMEGSRPRDVRVISASPEVLDVLGVRPLLGRGFLPEDADPGAPPVMLLRYDLWRDAFGSDPEIVGRTVTLAGQPAEVIGVLPPGFDFLMHSSLGPPLRADLYSALQVDLDSQPAGAGWLAALVRFRGGPESPAAQAALQRVGDRFTAEVMSGGTDRTVRLWAAPLKEDLVGGLQAPLTAILAAAGFLLLVLGANLATLFLARGAVRERDLAVRAAIGGSRRAVARSVLAEAGLVALAGAGGGLLLAWGGVRVLTGVAGALPRADEIGLDATGAAVAIGLALGLALLAALPPTVRARVTSPGLALREAAGSGDSRRQGRSRDALVVVQVALSLVLLVGSGLLARSFAELIRVDPGFDPGGTLTFRVGLYGDAYDDDAVVAFAGDLRDRLTGLPAVEAVGMVDALPLGQETNQGPVRFLGAPGNTGDDDADRPLVDLFFATPGYVEAAGLRVLDGRGFDQRDEGDGAPVALIDDVLADRFFPDGSAIGSRIATGIDTATIVGVLDQPRFYDIRSDDRGQVFLPHASNPLPGLRVAVRVGGGDPMALMPAARAAVAELDPGLAVAEVRTLDGIVADALGDERLNLELVTAFALAALLLSALGIYGVVANTVVRRLPEIGVRMALGAEAGRVARMVLAQGLRLVSVGVVVGLAGAWAASRSVAALLYGVEARDPLTFAGVATLLAAVGALAAWVPARRATRVDPAETLRRG